MILYPLVPESIDTKARVPVCLYVPPRRYTTISPVMFPLTVRTLLTTPVNEQGELFEQLLPLPDGLA